MSTVQDDSIRDYINKIKENTNKKIYIYGAGNMAKSLYLLCNDNEIDIKGFLVTDIKVNVNELLGLPVKQFDTVKLIPDETLILIGVIENGTKIIADMLRVEGWKNYISLTPEICTHISYMSEGRVQPMMEITTVIGCRINCRFCPQSVLIFFKNIV